MIKNKDITKITKMTKITTQLPAATSGNCGQTSCNQQSFQVFHYIA